MGLASDVLKGIAAAAGEVGKLIVKGAVEGGKIGASVSGGAVKATLKGAVEGGKAVVKGLTGGK